MSVVRVIRRGCIVLAVLAAMASSAGATTLIRAGLEELVAGNATIVLGEAVDAVSYWNSDHSFILTDVTVQPIETLKGRTEGTLTITLMGGSVGELTTLILGGPELIPGQSYLLFLNEEELPGAGAVTTVRDLVQGAYDVRATKTGELRAVSQANSHPLVPDRQGYVDAPGGVDGFVFEALVTDLRERVERNEREGVTR